MKLHHLRPAPGARTRKHRKGRGEAAGKGKTSGRGQKGTGARGTVPIWFEGGQMPLHRRLPKLGGFSNAKFKTEYIPVNIESLNKFEAGTTVDPTLLRDAGIVSKSRGKVKILGRGEITVALTVKAHAFSESAKAKIASAGGTAEVL
ncbi:MAG TPA: 50S ribosomal protein L15 [Actinomycetota bacterium]|nr:50S ribosomal protein L15 [Actinomycetota bacterium]